MDKKGHVLSDECIADEVPFEIPDGWCWTRLCNLLSLVSDGTHKTPTYVEKGVPFLSVKNVSKGVFDLTTAKYISAEEHRELCKRIEPRKGDILLCRIGTLGKPIIVNVDFEFSIFVSLGLLRPVSQDVVFWITSCIDSPLGLVWIDKVKIGGGTHTFKINLRDIPDFLIPLPPLAEQRRIVERINQLMPLVEEYGELEDAREELDASLPDRLRKSVLQMAVQGKLVAQNPVDEPASILLQRIRKERTKLVAEGKAKFPKGGESIIYTGSDGRHYEKRIDKKGHVLSDKCIEDEIPFEIPESWRWVRLGSIFAMQAGKNIKASFISDEQNSVAPFPCFGGNGIRGYVAKPNMNGDFPIIGRQGALCGNVKRATGEFYATEHAIVVTCFSNTDIAWACCFLTALNLNQFATATAQPGLAVSKILDVLIPLPPLAEQYRIVERLDHILYFFTNR